ncbi:MAG: PT domain-containing protein [Clostridia bacterium]|nr:PT domain-containing protein [Clostridia bacterium]MBQ4448194.1 PT domain-containing protein [Clostridia bacterium]
MEMNEKLFDAVGMIGGRHIEEARSFEVKKEKGRSLPMRLAYAAAACLALFAAGFGISRLINRGGFNVNGFAASLPSAEPTETVFLTVNPTLQPTDEPTAEPTPLPRIVYAGSKRIIDSDVPERGVVQRSLALEEALADPENEGCLFAVIISMSPWQCDDKLEWEEKRTAQIRELYTDPIIVEFLKDVTALAYENAEKAIIAGMAGGESLKRDIEASVEARGYYMSDLYLHAEYDIWKETKSPEEWEVFLAAKKYIDYQYLVADISGTVDGKTSMDIMNENWEKEETRWASLGYELLEQGQIKYMLLTKEQILNFPFEEQYGYKLLFVDEVTGIQDF